MRYTIEYRSCTELPWDVPAMLIEHGDTLVVLVNHHSDDCEVKAALAELVGAHMSVTHWELELSTDPAITTAG